MKDKLQKFNNEIIHEYNKMYEFLEKTIKDFDKHLDVLQKECSEANSFEKSELYSNLIEVRNNIVAYYNDFEILV